MKEISTARPAVFIDRDGTLIEEVNFLSRVNDLRVFPFTAEALELFKKTGFLVIVITNQSGIGRRIFDEAAVHEIHGEIERLLPGAVDAFFFCPHLPDEGCRCRKPKLGLIEDACERFDIDLSSSWFIGDKKIDIETGRNARLKTAMVLTGYGADHSKQLSQKPDIIAANLLKAAQAIAGTAGVPPANEPRRRDACGPGDTAPYVDDDA